MLHRVRDVKPPQEGQYITLELSNDREISLFEAGKMSAADEDWCVYGYNKEFGFWDLDFNGNERSYTPQYWDYLPFL